MAEMRLGDYYDKSASSSRKPLSFMLRRKCIFTSVIRQEYQNTVTVIRQILKLSKGFLMHQRISVFPPISFPSRNCRTICSPTVIGMLAFHIPNFGPWDVLILPLQMQTCFPSTTSQSKVADTWHQGTKPQLNSL